LGTGKGKIYRANNNFDAGSFLLDQNLGAADGLDPNPTRYRWVAGKNGLWGVTIKYL
jgi:hypothetical protein